MFKKNKVILNPATHTRNIRANIVLNNLAGVSSECYDEAVEKMRKRATNLSFLALFIMIVMLFGAVLSAYIILN